MLASGAVGTEAPAVDAVFGTDAKHAACSRTVTQRRPTLEPRHGVSGAPTMGVSTTEPSQPGRDHDRPPQASDPSRDSGAKRPRHCASIASRTACTPYDSVRTQRDRSARIAPFSSLSSMMCPP